MVEKFEYNGKWWLPDNPEGNITGTLRFTPDEGAVLDLMGSFNGSFGIWIGKPFKPEIILGTSSDGKNITLHKCFEHKRSDSTSGFPTSSFSANRVFIGLQRLSHN